MAFYGLKTNQRTENPENSLENCYNIVIGDEGFIKPRPAFIAENNNPNDFISAITPLKVISGRLQQSTISEYIVSWIDTASGNLVWKKRGQLLSSEVEQSSIIKSPNLLPYSFFHDEKIFCMTDKGLQYYKPSTNELNPITFPRVWGIDIYAIQNNDNINNNWMEKGKKVGVIVTIVKEQRDSDAGTRLIESEIMVQKEFHLVESHYHQGRNEWADELFKKSLYIHAKFDTDSVRVCNFIDPNDKFYLRVYRTEQVDEDATLPISYFKCCEDVELNPSKSIWKTNGVMLSHEQNTNKEIDSLERYLPFAFNLTKPVKITSQGNYVLDTFELETFTPNNLQSVIRTDKTYVAELFIDDALLNSAKETKQIQDFIDDSASIPPAKHYSKHQEHFIYSNLTLPAIAKFNFTKMPSIFSCYSFNRNTSGGIVCVIVDKNGGSVPLDLVNKKYQLITTRYGYFDQMHEIISYPPNGEMICSPSLPIGLPLDMPTRPCLIIEVDNKINIGGLNNDIKIIPEYNNPHFMWMNNWNVYRPNDFINVGQIFNTQKKTRVDLSYEGVIDIPIFNANQPYIFHSFTPFKTIRWISSFDTFPNSLPYNSQIFTVSGVPELNRFTDIDLQFGSGALNPNGVNKEPILFGIVKNINNLDYVMDNSSFCLPKYYHDFNNYYFRPVSDPNITYSIINFKFNNLSFIQIPEGSNLNGNFFKQNTFITYKNIFSNYNFAYPTWNNSISTNLSSFRLSGFNKTNSLYLGQGSDQILINQLPTIGGNINYSPFSLRPLEKHYNKKISNIDFIESDRTVPGEILYNITKNKEVISAIGRNIRAPNRLIDDAVKYIVSRHNYQALNSGSKIKFLKSPLLGEIYAISPDSISATQIGTGFACEPILSSIPRIIDEPQKSINSIVISKNNAPELTTFGQILNAQKFGDDTHPIVGTGSNGDNVYVFKTDGIWRFRLDNGKIINITQVSNSHKCYGAIETLYGMLLFITDRGFHSIQDGQIVNIGKDIEKEVSENVQMELLTNANSYYGLFPTSIISKFGLYTCRMFSKTDNAYRTYCYNSKVGQWTKWDEHFRSLAETEDGAIAGIYGDGRFIKHNTQDFDEMGVFVPTIASITTTIGVNDLYNENAPAGTNINTYNFPPHLMNRVGEYGDAFIADANIFDSFYIFKNLNNGKAIPQIYKTKTGRMLNTFNTNIKLKRMGVFSWVNLNSTQTIGMSQYIENITSYDENIQNVAMRFNTDSSKISFDLQFKYFAFPFPSYNRAHYSGFSNWRTFDLSNNVTVPSTNRLQLRTHLPIHASRGTYLDRSFMFWDHRGWKFITDKTISRSYQVSNFQKNT